MDGLLIFDNLNDVVFTKSTARFEAKLQKLRKKQGLPENTHNISEYQYNDLMQIFSPLVTSYRVMLQMSDPYTSIQLEDGTAVVFESHLGYLWLVFGEDLEFLSRFAKLSLHLAHFVTGSLTFLLKSCPWRRGLYDALISKWLELYTTEQSVAVEALEKLMVNSDIIDASTRLLRDVIDKGKAYSTDSQPTHAALFVGNKLLTFLSSRCSINILPADVLYLQLLSSVINQPHIKYTSCSCGMGETSHRVVYIGAPCLCGIPVIIHAAHITNSVHFIIISDPSRSVISSCASSLLTQFHAMQSTRQPRINKKTIDATDHMIKKLLDGLKKLKHKLNTDSDAMSIRSLSNITVKWEILQMHLHNYCNDSSHGDYLPPTTEASIGTLCDVLHDLLLSLSLSHLPQPLMTSQFSVVTSQVELGMQHYMDFLTVKSLNNLNLHSRESLTINKYLEEFPGLVHFIYIDRFTHQMVAPSLYDHHNDQLKNKVWSMLSVSHSTSSHGNLSATWSDDQFTYTHFLWFQDKHGNPVKPKIPPEKLEEPLPFPGIMGDNYYSVLVSRCFPGSASSVRPLEIFCIHLELATSQCVLEHARRLAATVTDILPNHNPIHS